VSGDSNIICENGCSESQIKPDPGCTAFLPQPCSFIHAIQTTNRVSRALQNVYNDSELTFILGQIDNSEFSPPNTFGFRPLVLSQDGDILAHSCENYFMGSNIQEAYHNFGWPTTNTDKIMERIRTVAGWINLPWRFPDIDESAISWLWHFSEVDSIFLNRTFYVGTAILDQVNPEDSACSYEYSNLCTIGAAKLSLGQVMLRLLKADDVVGLQLALAGITEGAGDERIWEMDPFVFRFDNRSNGECLAFTNHLNHVGENITEMWNLGVEGGAYFVNEADKDLHQEFVEKARGGGGWVKVNRAINATFSERLAVLVMGMHFYPEHYQDGQDCDQDCISFYVGVSFPHRRGEVMKGHLCDSCTGLYGEPCAIQNVRTLVGFTYLEFYLSASWDEISTKMNYNSEYRLGPLYVFAVRLSHNLPDRIIEAHGGNPALFVGYTAEVVFNRTFGQAELGTIAVDALSKAAWEYGEGWAEYNFKLGASETAIEKVSYAIYGYHHGMELLISSGFSRTPVPEDLPCHPDYGFTSCSEINIQKTVGAVVSSLIGTKTYKQVETVFQNVYDLKYNTESGFYPLVVDSSGTIVAHGYGTHLTSPDLASMLKTFAISSISEQDMLELLTNTGGNFHGSWMSIPWGSYREVVQELVTYSFAVSLELACTCNDSSFLATKESVTYYVFSGFINNPHPTVCGNCPSNGNRSCAAIVGTFPPSSQPQFCECDLYHATEVVFGDQDVCSLVPESNMQCILDAPECSVDDLEFAIQDCNNNNHRQVKFWWRAEVDGICVPGLELPESEYVACYSVPWYSKMGVIVLFVSTSGILFNFSTVWLVWAYRKKEPIKIAQPAACIILCFGGALLNSSVLLELGTFDLIWCAFKFIFFNFAACMVVSSLFVKVYRVYQIYMNTRLKKVQYTSKKVIMMVAKILLVDGVLVAISLIIYRPSVITNKVEQDLFSFEILSCSTDQLNALSLLSLGFKFGLLVVCCTLSYKVRKIDAKFNDVTSILLTVYNFAITVTFEYFLTHSFEMDRDFYVLIHSAAVWWATCISTAILIVPKTYYLLISTVLLPTNSSSNLQSQLVGNDESLIIEEKMPLGSFPSCHSAEVKTTKSIKVQSFEENGEVKKDNQGRVISKSRRRKLSVGSTSKESPSGEKYI